MVSISSLNLHRDIGITQKFAWHMLHRIRECWIHPQTQAFVDPVEGDQTCLGSKRANMHKANRAQLTGRGPVGNAIVAGVLDRTANQIAAEVVPDDGRVTLTGFLRRHMRWGAHVLTHSDAT